MASVKLSQVSKIYPHKKGAAPERAVNRIDMQIDDGEIVALLGSSGCGKTSTLRMIAGFESVTEGTISIGTREVQRLQPSERNVAMAFEAYALYPPLKVQQNIAFSLLRSRTPRAVLNEKISTVAKMLEIEDLLELYPPTLSGGQQQRVSLARALVRPADLYLLDEAMSQLEPQLRAVLRARIKEYLIAHRMTTVFVTHDQTEAMAMSDRIAVMSNGVLQQLASPIELKERPANLFVAGFIGEPSMNLLEASATCGGDACTLTVRDPHDTPAFSLALPASSALQALSGRPLTLGFRPHKVVVGRDPASAARADIVWIRGALTSAQWLGDQSQLGVQFGGLTVQVVTHQVIDMAVGENVDIGLPLDSLHLFDRETGERILSLGDRPLNPAA